MKTSTAAPAKPKLETQTCSRCCGTGKYSYCQMYGDVCFKCGGSGLTYTKRGLAAVRFYNASLCKRADELVPGDVIRQDAIKCSSFQRDASWHKVERTFDSTGNSRYMVNGVWYWPVYFVVKAEGFTMSCKRDTMIRVKTTMEQRTQKLALAIAYQSTLTKSGTPSKRKAS